MKLKFITVGFSNSKVSCIYFVSDDIIGVFFYF